MMRYSETMEILGLALDFTVRSLVSKVTYVLRSVNVPMSGNCYLRLLPLGRGIKISFHPAGTVASAAA